MDTLLRETSQRGAGIWTGDPPALPQATDLCERAIVPGVGTAQGSSASTDRKVSTLITHGSSGSLYVMSASCSVSVTMHPGNTLRSQTPDLGLSPEIQNCHLSALSRRRRLDRQSSRQLLIESAAQKISVGARLIMEYRVSYEHSLASAPNDFIARIASQLVDNVPPNIPRALLPEFITDLILKRSPQIGRIRNLRIL